MPGRAQLGIHWAVGTGVHGCLSLAAAQAGASCTRRMRGHTLRVHGGVAERRPVHARRRQRTLTREPVVGRAQQKYARAVVAPSRGLRKNGARANSDAAPGCPARRSNAHGCGVHRLVAKRRNSAAVTVSRMRHDERASAGAAHRRRVEEGLQLSAQPRPWRTTTPRAQARVSSHGTRATQQAVYASSRTHRRARTTSPRATAGAPPRPWALPRCASARRGSGRRCDRWPPRQRRAQARAPLGHAAARRQRGRRRARTTARGPPVRHRRHVSKRGLPATTTRARDEQPSSKRPSAGPASLAPAAALWVRARAPAARFAPSRPRRGGRHDVLACALPCALLPLRVCRNGAAASVARLRPPARSLLRLARTVHRAVARVCVA